MSEHQLFQGTYSKGNPLNTNSRSTRISGITSEIIVSGQEAINQKTKILSVGSYDSSRHNVSAVIRKMRNNYPSRQHESYYEQVIEKYQRLKQHGLPVLPTFRFDITSNSYLLTDLTHDGSIVIDKHTDPYISNRYSIQNASDLSHQLQNIAIQAFDDGNGVLLGYDAYLMTVKNNRGTIHLVDIFTGSYLLENSSAKELMYPLSISHALIRAQAFYNDIVEPLGAKST